MYETAYIIHILGIALWLGAFIGFAVLLRTIAVQEKWEGSEVQLVRRMVRFVNIGVLPASLLVLVTGVYMILQFSRDAMPLYLTIMEMGGSLVILLTMLVLGLYSRRLVRQLKEGRRALLMNYAVLLLLSAGGAAAVIGVVGLRLT